MQRLWSGKQDRQSVRMDKRKRSREASVVQRKLVKAFGILLILCALVLPGGLRADSVAYTFSGQLGGGVTESFEYVSPTFITSDVNIAVASLVSCVTAGPTNGACEGVAIQPSGPGDPLNHPEIVFYTPGTGNDFYFAYGSFATFGEYDEIAPFNPAHLSVTDVPDAVSTPEPSSWLLLSAGLICAVGWKFLQKQHAPA
jgi:hypothetical protein